MKPHRSRFHCHSLRGLFMTHTFAHLSVLGVLLLTGSTLARGSSRREQKRSKAGRLKLSHEQKDASSLTPGWTPFPGSPRLPVLARLDTVCDSTKTSAVIATVGGESTLQRKLTLSPQPYPNPNPNPLSLTLTLTL